MTEWQNESLFLDLGAHSYVVTLSFCCSLVSATELGEQAQDFQVQPDKRHEQSIS